jgi:hypothetical protein
MIRTSNRFFIQPISLACSNLRFRLLSAKTPKQRRMNQEIEQC